MVLTHEIGVRFPVGESDDLFAMAPGRPFCHGGRPFCHGTWTTFLPWHLSSESLTKTLISLVMRVILFSLLAHECAARFPVGESLDFWRFGRAGFDSPRRRRGVRFPPSKTLISLGSDETEVTVTSVSALKLRSLRFHSPRLCRITVFLIQTIVSLSSISGLTPKDKVRC